MWLVEVEFVFYRNQLLTAKCHVDKMRTVVSRLSEVENLFRSPDTGETWSVGTALGTVTSQLTDALSSFDALEIPNESLFTNSEPVADENTKHIDKKCHELQESIMLVIQTLYRTRETHSKEDEQTQSDEGGIIVNVVNGRQ